MGWRETQTQNVSVTDSATAALDFLPAMYFFRPSYH